MNNQLLNEEINPFPLSLQATQEWFASIITYPLGKNDTIQSHSPHGLLIAEEANRYITPNAHLQPHQRMQIYNQQYWWRLLNTLHINFPLVVRLFGYQAFNEKIGIPFLLHCPPNHWSLSTLGERLPKWIMECYHEPDQSLLYNAASLDWAFTACCIAPAHPPINLMELIQDAPENLLNYTFYLQPHVLLFSWEYNLLKFRDSFLAEEVDYWIEHPFPDLPKDNTYNFLLYRNANNHISWREICYAEFVLLEFLKKGATIKAVCEYIEAEKSHLYDTVENHLQQWLQNWTQAGLLTTFYAT